MSTTNPSSPSDEPVLLSTSEPQVFQAGSSEKHEHIDQENEQHVACSGDNHLNDQNATPPRDR